MCSKCADVDRLVSEVNEGKRTFDAEVLRATLTQARHVMDEALADIDSGDKPLHELLEVCSDTMQGLGTALFINSRTVAHAAHVERDRLVEVATKAERESADRKHLVDHITNQHNAEGNFDPAKLLMADLHELQSIHHAAHLPHIDVPETHLKDGR